MTIDLKAYVTNPDNQQKYISFGGRSYLCRFTAQFFTKDGLDYVRFQSIPLGLFNIELLRSNVLVDGAVVSDSVLISVFKANNAC